MPFPDGDSMSYIIQLNMKTKTVKKIIAKSLFFLLNCLRKKTEVWCNDINKVWKELVNHFKKNSETGI